MTFLHVRANAMNYVAAIHEGITGIHTIIQITSQILLKLLIVEVFNAEQLTKRTLLLMSTNPRWRRMLISRRISPTTQQTNASRSTLLTSVPEYSDLTPSFSCKQILSHVQTPTSPRQNIRRSYREGYRSDEQNPEGAKSKRIPNVPLDSVRRKDRCVSNSCFSDQLLSEASSLTETPCTTLSQISTSGQSTIKNTLHRQRKTRELKTFKLRHKRITDLQSPHLKINHRPDIDSQAGSHRVLTRSESNRSSISQKTLIDEIPNDQLTSTVIPKKLTSPESKSRCRSKTELSIRSKTLKKPNTGKVRSFPMKSRKRHKRKKISRSKNSSTTESSEALELFDENSSSVGVKLIAAGQHGFLKHASTGSDSIESSFTVISVEPSLPELIKDHVRTTRVVGTSIPNELVSKRVVHFPHSSHRSVCIQADGSDKTPCDSKVLFQKLLPRMNALATKRKQPSICASGQSSYSNFSNSRSYHGSQLVQSCSERACVTSVDVQYASSGKVKAILRVSSNLPSTYSSRCSTVWSGNRLTPIIQGVSLTPPRTPQTNNVPKTSKSGLTKKRA